MANTVSRGVRLPREIIEQIEAYAKQSGRSFNDIVYESTRLLLSPENTTAALTHRIGNLEENVHQLVQVMARFIPTIVEAEDKAFRSWSVGRLILAWADLVVDNGGMPSKEQWQKNKTEQIKKFDEQRVEIRTKLSAAGGDE